MVSKPILPNIVRMGLVYIRVTQVSSRFLSLHEFLYFDPLEIGHSDLHELLGPVRGFTVFKIEHKAIAGGVLSRLFTA